MGVRILEKSRGAHENIKFQAYSFPSPAMCKSCLSSGHEMIQYMRPPSLLIQASNEIWHPTEVSGLIYQLAWMYFLAQIVPLAFESFNVQIQFGHARLTYKHTITGVNLKYTMNWQ
jgi:hypothetical protein